MSTLDENVLGSPDANESEYPWGIFFNDTGADKLWASFGIGYKLLCHLMDSPETSSSDDIAVIESFAISLNSVSGT